MSHLSNAPVRRATERGYIIASTALLLIPLMIFAAFAVDVGGWYAEADRAQRAADAAALSGVVKMPDFVAATATARATALENGYDHSDPDVNVVVERRGSQGLHVQIETKGESYFGKVVLDEIDIDRFATAEYILPVPLGNPGSSLGSGIGPTGVPGAPRENLLLALNSYCQGYQNGDPFGVGWQGNRTCGDPGDIVNSRYDADGYDFIIDLTGPDDMAAPVTGAWDVQIFEPGLCNQDFESTDGTGNRIQTTLWKGDNTLFSDDDNKTDANRAINTVSGAPDPYLWPATACGSATSQWVTAYRIQSGDPRGRWVLNTRSLPNTAETNLNSYGIRVVPAGGTAPCGSLVASSSCPQVYARTWLPIYVPNNIRDLGGVNVPTIGGSEALFYLATIDEVHKGKTLEIKLFDPGEGMDNMQVLTPDNARLPFQIATMPEGGTQGSFAANTSTCTVGANTYECLRVAEWIAPAAARTDFYNGNEVTIRIQIPSNYQCVQDNPATPLTDESNCWWRIRYEPLTNPNTGNVGTVTDRTTWSIRVIGDPIRLTE